METPEDFFQTNVYRSFTESIDKVEMYTANKKYLPD